MDTDSPPTPEEQWPHPLQCKVSESAARIAEGHYLKTSTSTQYKC